MAGLKICITGSTGFIGKNLIEYLKDYDLDIVKFEGDLLNKKDVSDFFLRNKNINTCIHLAGTFSEDFNKLININVLATNNLLEESANNRVNRVIFSSTGAVYGGRENKLYSEKDKLNPINKYGLSKLLAENIIRFYSNNYDLKTIILRFPNIYGKYNEKGVIARLIKSIKENEEIEIYGDGKQERQFLNVLDACEALKLAIYYPESNIFNISKDKIYTINQIVAFLQRKYNFKIVYKESNNSLKRLNLETKYSSDKLKFKAKYKLEDYLNK